MESLDLAIVGMGLSGSRTLIELARSLCERGASIRPLRIGTFDRLGEFGRGVPYGAATDRKCLLIETLAQTRCPEFARWIKTSPAVLHALEHSPAAADRDWYQRNAARVQQGALDELFLPRHIFGQYSSELLNHHVELLESLGLANVRREAVEVAELAPAARGGYHLFTAHGGQFHARAIVIAVGSIPRRDPHWSALQWSHRLRYIKDDEFCGSFRLQRALDQFATEIPRKDLQIAIVGGAASAIESLHTTLCHPQLSERIARVTLISRSGVLPGNLRATDVDESSISPWALNRPSAEDYIEAARAALAQEILQIRAGFVEEVSPSGERMNVCFRHRHQAHVLAADLVINCSGAGDLVTTPAHLLRNLAAQLSLAENARGFRMRDRYELAEWPDVFVAGPLLNQPALESHVESISAVFRVAAELGPRIASLLANECEFA